LGDGIDDHSLRPQAWNGKLKVGKSVRQLELVSRRTGAAQRLALAKNGMGATRCAIHNLLSYHHLHRINDDMKLPKFLSALKSRRRGRSKARSDIGAIEGSVDADPVAPRPAESTPDLGISASKSSRLISPDQELNGTQKSSSQRRRTQWFLRGADPPSTSAITTGQSEDPNPSEHTIGQGAQPDSKPDLKSLASTGAELILRGVKEAADGFPPLKSVASALCFILDNYQVRRASHLLPLLGLRRLYPS
jgi:hypothetical protein